MFSRKQTTKPMGPYCIQDFIFFISPSFGFSSTPTILRPQWPMHLMKVLIPTNMEGRRVVSSHGMFHQDWPSGVPSWDVHVQVRGNHGWRRWLFGGFIFFEFPLTVWSGTPYSMSDGFWGFSTLKLGESSPKHWINKRGANLFHYSGFYWMVILGISLFCWLI